MKLTICAVPYSDNLGDLLIFDSLVAAIKNMHPEIIVNACDLGGRTQFKKASSSRRLKHLRLLNTIPKLLRPILPLIQFGILSRQSLTNHYRHSLADTDVAIIGGGHLFADLNLNFPTKLQILGQVIGKMEIPTVVYAVGANKWSVAGQCLMSSFLKATAPRSIAARDDSSAMNIQQYLTNNEVSLVFDPALMASYLFPMTRSIQRKKPQIGINVIGTEALKADGRVAVPGSSDDFYEDLIRNLRINGFGVSIFSNGAEEDQARVKRLSEFAVDASIQITTVPRPTNTHDLIDATVQCDAIISHRLHANILAYSYGVPSVGLDWDSKVSSFFASVNRNKFCLTGAMTQPSMVVASVTRALDEGIDLIRRDEIITISLQQIKSMIASVSPVPKREQTETFIGHDSCL